MSAIYRAIQVTKPGEFGTVMKPLVDPGLVKCAFASRRPVPATRSIDLGVGPEPIGVTSVDLIFGERKIAGSLTGNPATADATLRFPPISKTPRMLRYARPRLRLNRIIRERRPFG